MIFSKSKNKNHCDRRDKLAGDHIPSNQRSFSAGHDANWPTCEQTKFVFFSRKKYENMYPKWLRSLRYNYVLPTGLWTARCDCYADDFPKKSFSPELFKVPDHPSEMLRFFCVETFRTRMKILPYNIDSNTFRECSCEISPLKSQNSWS